MLSDKQKQIAWRAWTNSQCRGEGYIASTYAAVAAVLEDAQPAQTPSGEAHYPAGRCQVCGWPLRENLKDGCVSESCSFRPDDPQEQAKLRARREWLKTNPYPAEQPAPQQDVEPWPESTCAECGKRIEPGRVRVCEKGGECSWRVPSAIRAHMRELEQQLASAKPEIKHVICNDCKGHQIFTTEEDTIYVLHDCAIGNRANKMFDEWKQQLASTKEQVERARADAISESLAEPTSDEARLAEGSDGDSWYLRYCRFLNNRRARLAQPEPYKPHYTYYKDHVTWDNPIPVPPEPEPKPRVTVEESRDGFIPCWKVMLDGSNVFSMNSLQDAERYAAGLRAEIGESK